MELQQLWLVGVCKLMMTRDNRVSAYILFVQLNLLRVPRGDVQ